jgi:aromatic-L-amino-acid/L-tryptophan decarboxylase
MNFDLNSQVRRELGYHLIDVVDKFFDSLPERPVQLPLEERSYPSHLNPLPESADDPAKVLDEVCRELIDNGFHVPSAHYLGMMNPAPTYMSFLAESQVSALNPQLASVARSQLASRIEAEAVRWVGGLVGWPSAFSGTFTSGGNEANFGALAMAMSHYFPDLIEEGRTSIGAQPVFYASVEGHHSLDKSAGLLGIGRKALRRIPVNDRLEMDAEKLEASIERDLAAAQRLREGGGRLCSMKICASG